MTTPRLDAYRRKLLSIQETPDLQDITDDELEEAKNPEFIYFKDDPAWPSLLHAVLELLGQCAPGKRGEALRCVG